MSDINEITEDLSKHFIVDVESDISTFTTHMKDINLVHRTRGDLALIINLKQVRRGTKKESWIEAMQMEVVALTKNKTWNLVPQSPNSNIVSCKWIFTKKYEAHGT